jgi:hypothetical protein
VQVRLHVTQRIPSPLELKAAPAQSNAIQEAPWSWVKEVAAKNNGRFPTGLFIQSLNEMIDDNEKRLTASISSVPNIVLMVLYGVAIIGNYAFD